MQKRSMVSCGQDMWHSLGTVGENEVADLESSTAGDQPTFECWRK